MLRFFTSGTSEDQKTKVRQREHTVSQDPHHQVGAAHTLANELNARKNSSVWNFFAKVDATIAGYTGYPLTNDGQKILHATQLSAPTR